MSSPGDDSNSRLISAFALAGQLGFAVALPIVAGVAVGTYLDERTDSHGLFLAGCVLAGVGVGIYSAYRLLAKVISK